MPAVITIVNNSTADPCGAPPRPPAAGSPNVLAGGNPVVRVGDPYMPHPCPASPPHPGTATGGAGTVFVNGQPIHRTADAISCGSFGGAGVATVTAGDQGV